VDLKSAYLQIHVAKDLWKYQVVRHKGVHYALTRLGFGLSRAPTITTSILGKVLSIDDRVRRATEYDIDDIVVQGSFVGAEEVRKHLTKYELETKEPESLDGYGLLGIALKSDRFTWGQKISQSAASSPYVVDWLVTIRWLDGCVCTAASPNDQDVVGVWMLLLERLLAIWLQSC